MIDLYFWTTPNGYKPMLFLEEAGVPYNIVPVNISKGEQFEPDFLAISPNNRIPAIVDHEPAAGGAPISIFESGAILLYLAEKTGRFLPPDLAGRAGGFHLSYVDCGDDWCPAVRADQFLGGVAPLGTQQKR